MPVVANGIRVDAPYRLIQGIRLVHALMESSYRVHVPTQHADKFTRLREAFGADFTVGADGVPELTPVALSHREPRTAIGSLERPLIFPHAIVRHCRRLWAAERTVRVSFAGLLTDKRRAVLDRWVRGAIPAARVRLGERTLLDRLKSGAWRRQSGSGAGQMLIDSGDLVLWASDRGRQFPGKSWDEEYHALLARSQFVLCPCGDYVWSYRFFEAVLCGAVPIVEQPCPAYDGFSYRTMDDSLSDARWNPADAQRNAEVCEARLTVPTQELNAEIASLLAGSRREVGTTAN